MISYTIYTIFGSTTINSNKGACLAEAQYIWDALANLHGKSAMISTRP